MDAYTRLPVNPFEDYIVSDPHAVSFSVPGLNDAPLNRLIARFALLDAKPAPRTPPRAAMILPQLVISPDRGYGKSHLLGRLFHSLAGRATTVYVRPYQDPDRAWHSILLATLTELQRPEGGAPRGAPTQLMSMAVAILARIALDLIEAHGVPGRPEAAEAVVRLLQGAAADPTSVSDAVRHWIEWLLKQMDGFMHSSRVVCDLQDRGIDLLGREKAWVKVLAAHALVGPRGPRALVASKWLRAEALEPEEIRLLDIDAADADGRADGGPKELNGLAFQRLRGLCMLASHHRPFLFCFDQTEVYARDRELVFALGRCIEALFAELPNQLTVVTSNAGTWTHEIVPHFETPQRDRFSTKIDLEGVDAHGARALITQRLRDCAFTDGEVARFFADGWLEEVFTIPERGVRDVLKHAIARFDGLSRTPPRPVPLEDLFKQEVNAVRAGEALMAYRPDALMWLVKEVGQGLGAVSIQRLEGRRYFSYAWSWPDRLVAFAFEGGSHALKWQAIARESGVLSEEGGGRTCLFYALRTPDLEHVPRESWKQVKPVLDEAQRHGFNIIGLTQDEVCEIHGACELHAKALQGDIGYPADETLSWLQAHFAPFMKGLAYRRQPSGGPRETPRQAPPDLSEPIVVSFDSFEDVPTVMPPELGQDDLAIVTEIVRDRWIVPIDTVLDRLGSDSKRDALLRSVEHHPNLKAQPGPETIYLQWRITPTASPRAS